MESHYQPADERIIDDLEALRIYFDPLRAQIIQAVGQEPRTIHQVAEALGVPFTRLYYHFQLLEKHGFIRQVDARSYGGAVEEKYYMISARMFLVDRSLMTIGETDDDESGLEIVLDTVLNRTKDDIRRSARAGTIELEATAPDPQALFIVRGYSYLSPDSARDFYTRLRALVDQFITEPDQSADETSERSQLYGFAVTLYPSATEILPGEEEERTGAE